MNPRKQDNQRPNQQRRPYQRRNDDQQERAGQASRSGSQNRSNDNNNSNKQNRFNHQNRSNDNFDHRNISNDNFNHQNRSNQQKKYNKKSFTLAKLPKFITFNDNSSNIFTQFKYKWPRNKMFVIDFYPRAQVPVIYIDSSDTAKLEKHLPDHQQDIILIDIDWTPTSPISIFEICTKKGVLLVHNSSKSEQLIDFIKNNKIFTKGSEKVQRLIKYVNSRKKLNLIDIDEQWIIPKRYPRSFDYLLRSFLGDPNYNFRPKSIRSSNFSLFELSCSQVMCCAYKAVSEYMLIPIVKSAPKTIGEAFKQQQKLLFCVEMPFNFDKNKITKVTYIPNIEEEQKFILPMIEKLYDGKAFVKGKLRIEDDDDDDDDFDINEIFGYGTSNGILITQKEVSPFKHVSIPISEKAIDKKLINKIVKSTQWRENKEIVQLAIKIHFTIETNKKRPSDPVKGNAKFPSFAKYKPAKFEIPFDIPHKSVQSVFTILQIPVNPDYYVRFSLPVLESIQRLQEEGFYIPKARSFDIDEMCESVRIDDISNDLEKKIKKLIDSFPKIELEELQDLLKDIEPKSGEENAYARIIESEDFTDLKKSDIKKLLSILNREFKQRNKLITQLCSVKSKDNDEINKIMNELLVTIKPSDDLVNRINCLLAKYDFNFDTYLTQLNKVKKHLKKMKIDEDQKDELIEEYKNSIENLKGFVSNNIDCFDQIQLILKAFLNLKCFDSDNSSPEEINLFVNNSMNMISAVNTYINFISSHKYKPIQIIENLLFNLIFRPSDNDAFTTVYAVYQMHDKFLFNKDSFANFKSSTGSGKTRCAPFFFSIKALMDRMEHPFFIMTQPGASIISDKMTDFKNVLGENNVILVQNIFEMIKLYKKGKPSKPVVALFSPHNALRLLAEAENEGIDIISKTRFCLDEIHERSVDTDVFIAKLSDLMKKQENFPLQVLMMSATPDKRVLKCFGEVKHLNLPDSQLFPIDTIKKEVDTKNKVSDEAATQTIEILKKMARGEKQLGHILVFTSGNSRINEISIKIGDKIKEAKKELQKEIDSLSNKHGRSVPDDDDDESDDDESDDFTFSKKNNNRIIIRNLRVVNDINLTNVKEFNHKIDDITKDDNTTLFIILIKFAGFVPSAQKEIAKNIIKKHDNVIKIILATNAIESSITIDQLSAVVDTGIFNQPQFDTQRGLTKLSEEPISLQSQVQRKGRVGRVRPGISVQISIKNHPFKEFLPPEIQTTDISSNIISLRKIGFKLESIKNLPDPIDSDAMDQFMIELYSIGAINKKTGELTDSGQKISQFESLSPFLAASIMKAASSFEDKSSLLEVLGSLIVLIFNSSELVIDPFAQPLQDNYDENSDIITLLRTFLDLVNHKSWKLKAINYGLNSKIVQAIISTTNNICENLKVEHEEKNIFLQLIKIINEIDLMDFIQKIINSIESFKSSWIQCRKATFMTIDNIIHTPSLIYIGDKSLAFDDDVAQAEITLGTRPGSKGLISPGSAYIFNISHNESMSINFGSCIHRNLKDDPIEDNETYKFVRPKTLSADISLFAQEEFTSCLLNVFLQGNENGFRTFNALRHTGIESGKIIFSPSLFKGKCIFTYAPIDKNSDTIFKKAVKQVSLLLPYTPSTILIRHQLLHCAIAINFLTIDKPNSRVYFFKEKDCYPYQINKETLNFILKNVDDFSCEQNQIFIAITGEMLSIPLDSENGINFDSIRRPTIDPKCNYVFSDDSYFYSHMVILSNMKIPGQTPIPWTKNAIYADYAPADYITKVANGIFPDLLSVKECEKMIFFHNSNVTIDGSYPNTLGFDEFLYRHNTLKRPVDAMFDRFAMGCINTYKLSQDVNLRSFEVNGPKLSKSLIRYHSLQSVLNSYPLSKYQEEYSKNTEYFKRKQYNKNNQDDYKNTSERINALKKQKSDNFDKQNKYRNLDWSSLDPLQKQMIKSEQASIKSQKERIKNELDSLYQHLNDIKVPPKPDIDPEFEEIFKFIQSPIEYQVAQQLTQSSNQFHISQINKKGEIALCIPISMNEEEKPKFIDSFLRIIRPLNPETYKQEEIPLYEITFNHAKNSPLTQEEFRERILNVSKKFGAIISRVSKYVESNTGKNPTVQGHVYVYMFSATFTIPFASMSSDEIFGKNTSVLRIPMQMKIDLFALSRDKKMISIMKNWLSSNDLEIQFVHNKWIGPKSDIEKALELLKSSPPQFPTKTIQIQSGVDLVALSSKLKKQAKLGKKKWFVNLTRKTITVPTETNEDEVKSFIEKYKQVGNQTEGEEEEDNEIIGDINYCEEDALLSTKLINVYNVDNNTVQTKNFCRVCIRESIVYSLGKMFDENNNIPIMNKIYENIDFIQPIPLLCSNQENKSIPLGQLIWSFIADSDIAAPARTYITAIAFHTLRKSPFVTYCPQHPSIIFRKPPLKTELKCIVSGCNCILCSECNKWHPQGDCPEKQSIPLGDRVCPYCHSVIEKSIACNHLHCNCGKHFCYYCGAGPWDDSTPCYNHLSKEHCGHSNDPPDYRKFIKHDNSVTEQELEDFYKKYPIWRDFKI